jgi:flagellin
MRELAVQAANDTLTTADRAAINSELTSLRTEIDAIVARTTFNGKSLLDGSLVTAVAATSNINVGTVVTDGTDSGHITALDVSAARPGATFTFSYNSTTSQLTLTRSGDNVSQTVTLPAAGLPAGQSLNLDFAALGVRLTLTTTGGFTDADAIGNAFNTRSITTASGGGSANMQVGPNATHFFNVNFQDVRINGGSATEMQGLGTALNAFNTALGGNNAGQVTAAQNLITAVDTAIGYVNSVRSNLGAVQNRLEHAIANLGVAHENLVASESRIRDVDMAAEMVTFTRGQILQQAGIAVLAQANTIPQSVLQLLR